MCFTKLNIMFWVILTFLFLQAEGMLQHEKTVHCMLNVVTKLIFFSFIHSLLPIRTGTSTCSLSASRKFLNNQKHPGRRGSSFEGIFFVPA